MKSNGQWLNAGSPPSEMFLEYGTNENEFLPDIAIDPTGIAHVVFWHQPETGGEPFFAYARLINGSWTSWDIERTYLKDQLPHPDIKVKLINDVNTVGIAYVGIGPTGTVGGMKYAVAALE
jgi:hypothetical protein